MGIISGYWNPRHKNLYCLLRINDLEDSEIQGIQRKTEKQKTKDVPRTKSDKENHQSH